MTCQEAIALLGDYLAATLGVSDAEEFEAHLQDCDECVAYLNTYRKTSALARAAAPVEMPAEMRKRLRGFLIAKLSQV